MLKRFVATVGFYLFASYVCATGNNQTITIVISIDGFANSYFEQYQPTTLSLLAKQGVKAEALLPSFPTKTFPNHLAMMTGKKPFQHGIFLNKFYDKQFKDTYRYGQSNQPRQWLKFPPIWSLLEQRDIKTAILFFPESTTPYLGVLPSYAIPYDESWSDDKRFEQLYRWLTLPNEQRPQFIAGYFSSIDKVGHRYGTRSPELARAITNFDKALANFTSQLDALPFDANLVIVSDHGMVNIDNEKAIDVDKLLADLEVLDTIVINSGTQLIFYNNDRPKLEELAKLLRQRKDSRFDIFENGSFPKAWSVPKNSTYAPDIILSAKLPFVFMGNDGYTGSASHGFEPTESMELNAIFVAKGPSFSRQREVPSFANTVVFTLLSHIYGLEQPKLTTEKEKNLLKILMP
ncbi:alkaline phosphatase family protein [Thalassotalea ganghwensis]